MFSKFVYFLLLSSLSSGIEDSGFIYNNFRSSSVRSLDDASVGLDGTATFTDDGALRLTGEVSYTIGRAFYTKSLEFKNSSNGTALSFSTTFVFAMNPKLPDLVGEGFAFFIAPPNTLGRPLVAQYLGLFNESALGNISYRVLGVEFDTTLNPEFGDINDNHVGIDINDLRSVISAPASYFTSASEYKNLSLISRDPMQVWIDYDGLKKLLNVTISPIHVRKPKIPLLSLHLDISPILLDKMYVGFAASTGSIVSSHYILGWSFKMNGHAQELNMSSLPKLPRFETQDLEHSRILKIVLPVVFSVFLLSIGLGIFLVMKRKKRYAEVLEDWEQKYGPHRFSYKDLYLATKGFKDRELLGKGGFGRVYRGVILGSRMQVAVVGTKLTYTKFMYVTGIIRRVEKLLDMSRFMTRFM